MTPAQPVLVAHLFGELGDHLVALLEDLTDAEWRLPTTSARWSVRDVAAHLLDGDLRRLSFQRDGHMPPPPEESLDDPPQLLAYLNRLNAEWVAAAARLSPRVLTELQRLTAPMLADLFISLDPFADAIFPVGWAGDEVSPNWFDTAREYTEKWIHQQQIREATGRESLDEQRYLLPVVDTSLRGVPFAYRDVAAPAGTVVAIVVEGGAGGVWSLRHQEGSWALHEGPTEDPAAAVTMSQDTAWRFFSTRQRKAELMPRIAFAGDARLAEAVAGATSVMA